MAAGESSAAPMSGGGRPGKTNPWPQLSHGAPTSLNGRLEQQLGACAQDTERQTLPIGPPATKGAYCVMQPAEIAIYIAAIAIVTIAAAAWGIWGP